MGLVALWHVGSSYARDWTKPVFPALQGGFFLLLLLFICLFGSTGSNLDSILKSRDITLPTRVRLVKAMVFPVAMYGCESWTVKKAEHWRIDAFELWCWRRLLRVPWTARRSNQSILKEIGPEVFIGRTNAEAETPTLVTWCKELTHL